MKQEENYINPCNRQALRDAIIFDITQGEADFNYAVTLTFPYAVYSRSVAQERCRFFRDKYNKMLGYRSNHIRGAKHNKTLSAPFAAMLEGDGITEHFHYHIALHKPDNFSQSRYEMMITLLWGEVTHDKDTRVTVEPIYSDGWAAYITKQVKTGNTDILDDKNYNVY